MRRVWITVLIFTTFASTALAVVAGKDLYLPSVGHGQGQCPGGICSQWRSDAWIYNPSSSADATVQVYFLARDQENASPPSASVTVAPGETRELLDVVFTVFGLDGAYGALRFVSDREVVVAGRVYDENVQTNKGVGAAGQYLAALPAGMALGTGESSDLIGLAQDAGDVSRSNFGFVETAGATATVEVTRRDALGVALASRVYQVRPHEAIQKSIADIGGAPGFNQRVEARVTGGNGRVLPFASRVDNRTGDPSTVEMWLAPAEPVHATGVFQGGVWDPTGTLLDGVVQLSLSEAGLLAYEGTAGIPCGSTESYVVDFGDTPPVPVEVTDGAFTTTATLDYSDGSSTVFTITWTLTGELGSDGVVTGTLRSDTSGGTGTWAACNAVDVSRSWRAGWTGSQ